MNTLAHPTPETELAPLPPASIVICSRNRPELLNQTVAAILQGIELPAEIVIVDQSEVPDVELTTFVPPAPCSINYIWTPIAGVSRARNTAIGAAHNAVLVLIDDDILVTATWFGTIVRRLVSAGQGSAVTGKVLAEAGPEAGGFVPSTIADETPQVYMDRAAGDVLFTGNMAIYRSLFEQVGRFDERLGPGAPYPAAEDNDYGYRLLAAGYKIVYAPHAIVYHRAWRSDKDYLRLRWNYGRGQGAFFAKHLSFSDLYIARRMIKELARRLVRIPMRTLHERHFPTGDLLYILGLCSGATHWLLFERARRQARGAIHDITHK